jgi:hypothetical protein
MIGKHFDTFRSVFSERKSPGVKRSKESKNCFCEGHIGYEKINCFGKYKNTLLKKRNFAKFLPFK